MRRVAQTVRASPSGMSRVECPRFPDSNHQLLKTVHVHQLAPLYCLLVLCTYCWPIDTDEIRSNNYHLFAKIKLKVV